jgi:L-asparaginase/Glu-tRNA(Gln) amidotransferase subunit D
MDTPILVFRITPNFDYSTIVAILKKRSHIRVLIFELYGFGNMDLTTPRMSRILAICQKKGVLLVGVTQSMFGGVKTKYNSAKELTDKGMIFLADMTTEACMAKLAYLLGKYQKQSNTMIRTMLLENIRGEITPSSETINIYMMDSIKIRNMDECTRRRRHHRRQKSQNNKSK